jgi:integrase
LSRKFLTQRTPCAHKAHRGTLNLLWKYAINTGLAHENPVDNTEIMLQPPRQRHRHTWDGYQAILTQAEPWLAHAMEIALHSVQRRSDLTSMKWKAVDMNKQLVNVKQIKTGTYIAIEMSNALYKAFSWFDNSPLECPYVVHRKPAVKTQRLMDAVQQGRQHIYEITPDALTKAFCQARERSGYYNHLHPEERPTFHDLRALGMFALGKAGYPLAYIQALAGHADTKMTTLYLEGHETVQPQNVAAGNLDDVDWSNINWSTPLAPELVNILD